MAKKSRKKRSVSKPCGSETVVVGQVDQRENECGPCGLFSDEDEQLPFVGRECGVCEQKLGGYAVLVDGQWCCKGYCASGMKFFDKTCAMLNLDVFIYKAKNPKEYISMMLAWFGCKRDFVRRP